VIQEVKKAVQGWEKEAKILCISTLERELKANAFRMAFIEQI
jgi:hypothetical protein